MKKSLFITFEGIDGSGKSTIAKLVYEELNKKGYDLILSREPGGVKIAEDIRAIILDRKNTNLDDRTEALLFASSRRQHLVEKILPALNEGKIVLCDRYIDSSLAYQGAGKGLGIDNVLNINLFATENKLPDLTILFDLEPEDGLGRINKSKVREVNRLDLEKLSFYHKCRNAYLELAKRYDDRYKIVDASKDINTVLKETLEIIINKIEEN